MTNYPTPNLQNLDKKVFKNITDYLTELRTIRIDGKPQQNSDGSITIEFKDDLFQTEDYVFHVSGYMSQSKKAEKRVFFFSISDQKDHKKVIKFSQKQHKEISELIKDKITI